MRGRAGSGPAGIPKIRAQTSAVAALPPVVGDLALTEISDTLVAAGTIASPSVPFYLVTSFTPPGSASRNDFTGKVGFKFYDSLASTYDRIGLRCITGNTGLRSVALYALDGTQLRQANVDLTGGTDGQFYYASITPITLSVASGYFLAVDVVSGDGYFWLNPGPTTLASTLAYNVQAVYYYTGGGWTDSEVNKQFAGVDLSGVTGVTDALGTLTRTEANDILVAASMVMPSGIGLVSPIDMISNTEHPPYIVAQSSTG